MIVKPTLVKFRLRVGEQSRFIRKKIIATVYRFGSSFCARKVFTFTAKAAGWSQFSLAIVSKRNFAIRWTCSIAVLNSSSGGRVMTRNSKISVRWKPFTANINGNKPVSVWGVQFVKLAQLVRCALVPAPVCSARDESVSSAKLSRPAKSGCARRRSSFNSRDAVSTRTHLFCHRPHQPPVSWTDRWPQRPIWSAHTRRQTRQ